jgi:hypothetical protein
MERLFNMQKTFHENLHGRLDNLTTLERENITKVLALAMHQEVSALAETIHYKSHHTRKADPDLNNLVYESVDVIRYAIAIMNTWDVDPERFLEAYNDKGAYLNLTQQLEKKKWEGQPVVIIDMDDVVVEFRSNFSKWLKKEFDVETDISSSEYYFIDALRKTGHNPEAVFIDFLNSGGFKRLTRVMGMSEAIRELHNKGYWLHVLTARPEENLRCKYDTYAWILNNNLMIDRISFSTEKFRWCANSQYYDTDSIVCAIDDSPKHATEYAKHGLPVLLPVMPYNQSLAIKENIHYYTQPTQIINLIENLK